MKKIQLTPEDQELVDNLVARTLPYATWTQLIRMVWWGWFNHKRRNKLVECMIAGMSFKFAYEKAKTF